MDDYNSVLDSEGQELLTRVIDNAKRMAELIDDLLELSRLGRKELHTIQIDFNRLVNDISQSYLRNQEQHEVKFTCEDLGSVTGDLGLLKVVIDNLLGNAWKYTAKVDKACITVGKQHTAGEDVFFIKDNGAGFDMNYVNKIFGAFQRLHKRDEFEGTGIGLATVQRIIHRHGGRIWAEAKPGKGATFYFTLGPAKNITTEAPSDILVQSE
jgi:light-regulated signal transduction histidine kinase (bacteriophytochrome)